MIKAAEEQKARFSAFRDELEMRYGAAEVAKACQRAINIDLKDEIDSEVEERLEEERAEIREDVIAEWEDTILVWASLILKEQEGT
jgi:hypothetical protein